MNKTQDKSLQEVPLPGPELLERLVQAEAQRLATEAKGRIEETLSEALYGVAIERNDRNRLLIVLGRRSIEERNLRLVEQNLERVVAESFHGEGFGRLVQFTTDGYTEDSRPLWEIPEVVSYFKLVQEQLPYLPYWMGKECIALYGMILTGHSPAKQEKLLLDIFASGNFMCEHIYQLLTPDDKAKAAQLSENLIRLASERIQSALIMPL